jgi:PAS domain S-box-containing protein
MTKRLDHNGSVHPEERLQRLLETTNILPWEADAETWRFTFVGEQAIRMMGYPTAQWYGPDFWPAHIHPDDRKQAIEFCIESSALHDKYEFEYRMIASDGRVVWIHDLVNVLRENGRAKRLTGFMIDITERKQTEEKLRELSGRLIKAQEEERSRIARELHDNLNQRMALLSIELEQLGQTIPDGQDNIQKRVHDLWTNAQEISSEIHRLSYQLHPTKLDHLGLASAVKSLCDELQDHHGIRIEFKQRGFPATLPKDVTLCVFRIAQESLRNVIKHSGVNEARVILDRNDDAVQLTVSDLGRGFDTNSDLSTIGLGFISMRERLRLVGGRISIHSEPSCGTQIEVSVPFK